MFSSSQSPVSQREVCERFETKLCPVCASGSAADAAVKYEQLKPERMIPKQKSRWDLLRKS